MQLLTVLVAGASLLASCLAATCPDQVKTLKTLPSPLISPSELSIYHQYRLLRTSADEDDTEERVIDTAMVAKMRAEMEAIDMKFNFRDWFQSGKTLEQVRSILGLPATGEAASHINWAAFQNYLKYVQEMEVKAANAARVAEIKQKLTFKGWYLDGKSFAQVRAILGLPAKGSAVGHLNWETFQAYLKFFKEYSQQFT